MKECHLLANAANNITSSHSKQKNTWNCCKEIARLRIISDGGN
jgi:hypothetical protein